MTTHDSRTDTQVKSVSRQSLNLNGQDATLVIEHQQDTVCLIRLELSNGHEPLVQHLLDAYFRLVVDRLNAGTPLSELLTTMLRERFEPMGISNREEVFFAGSLIDYVGRKLAVDFLGDADRFLLLYQQPPPGVEPPS